MFSTKLREFKCTTLASLQAHDVSRLLTYNPRDFNRYGDIAPVRPDEVA
ncbi:MAG: hypothetical protein ABI824_15425 [Acidobacteriota bacterium]